MTPEDRAHEALEAVRQATDLGDKATALESAHRTLETLLQEAQGQ